MQVLDVAEFGKCLKEIYRKYIYIYNIYIYIDILYHIYITFTLHMPFTHHMLDSLCVSLTHRMPVTQPLIACQSLSTCWIHSASICAKFPIHSGFILPPFRLHSNSFWIHSASIWAPYPTHGSGHVVQSSHATHHVPFTHHTSFSHHMSFTNRKAMR